MYAYSNWISVHAYTWLYRFMKYANISVTYILGKFKCDSFQDFINSSVIVHFLPYHMIWSKLRMMALGDIQFLYYTSFIFKKNFINFVIYGKNSRVRYANKHIGYLLEKLLTSIYSKILKLFCGIWTNSSRPCYNSGTLIYNIFS